jgi:hypothetical protein
MKKTVGLLALTNTGKATLQVRGNFNVEKNEPETYTGATQLTIHGSLKENEREIDALLRETREELGKEFANLVQGRSLDLIELNKVENKNFLITNFGLRIDENDLKKIKIDERTGTSIRLISKNEISKIRELKPSERLSGVKNKNDIAMFPDDIEAVRLAFEKLT